MKREPIALDVKKIWKIFTSPTPTFMVVLDCVWKIFTSPNPTFMVVLDL